MFTSLLKDMTGTDAQPSEEIRARSGRVWSAGVSVTGRQHPPDVDVFINLEVLRTLCYWCFMEVFSNRHDQLLTPFPAPLPSLQKWEWGGAENTKLLTMACFLWTIPIEEPTQRHFGKIKDAPSGCVTYKFTGVRNPASGTRSKTNIKTGNAPSVLIT